MARKGHDEAKQARRFGQILPVMLLALAGLAWWRDHPWLARGLAGAAPIVLLTSLVLPGPWLRLFRRWMQLAEVLSWVMTRVILSVFFFGILTPIGLVMRVVGARPMNLKWKDGQAGYWIDKAPGEYTLERYEKQF